MPRIHSFAPIARRDARVLILGSMPGAASLAAGCYYAHPRNAFWPILGALLGFAAHAGYAQRLRALRDAGIALWDVLHSCEREGSLDGDIRKPSMRPNDFAAFFRVHRRIRLVACNGSTAWAEFARVARSLPSPFADLPRVRLPSTSPAHASRSFADKLAAWRAMLAPALA